MDPSTTSLILQELNLNKDCVANIYNHGSWVYGTNTPNSDRDIIIITRLSDRRPLKFTDSFEYFHQFELHRLWNQYDVCIYSIENFEALLQINYLVVVQCVFLPDEFKIKEEIDFRKIYLEKDYNTLKLKQAVFYEMQRYCTMYNSNNYSNYPIRSSRTIKTGQLRKDFVLKSLFHGLRYLDFVEQLIQTRSIYNYKRITYIYDEMKAIIRGDPPDNSSMARAGEFVHIKCDELQSKLDVLVPTNIIKGSFEVYITLDFTDHTEQAIEILQKACENTKYKLMFIQLDTDSEKKKLKALMVSSYYYGEYPSIFKQIEEEAYQAFQDFNIIRIKIKSSVSNEGVPQTDMEKKVFWNDETNYFEFHYKIPLEEECERDKLRSLVNMCRPYFKYDLHSSDNVYERIHQKNPEYMITMRLFDFGRENALKTNKESVEELTINNSPPLQVVCEFIVYDTHIELDKDWQQVDSTFFNQLVGFKMWKREIITN
ncbi:unnamed protein product [Rotaria sordida]|uniref:Polymerase nucleotidyl transferase domain-containing protein n=1 Tax=Rotaria sordida TaxID=392033 RepID=A0A819TRV3_9BILA|nr:unnamed protein product [Rotaria sordida]